MNIEMFELDVVIEGAGGSNYVSVGQKKKNAANEKRKKTRAKNNRAAKKAAKNKATKKASRPR